MNGTTQVLEQMNARSREVFRLVVEGYLASGDPVGSRSVAVTMTLPPRTRRDDTDETRPMTRASSPGVRPATWASRVRST